MKVKMLGEDALVGAIEEAVPHADGVLAMYAGTVRWDSWDGFLQSLASGDEEVGVDRLLDLRAYDARSELHAQRSALGEEFMARVVQDVDYASDEMLDDVQLLDIDATRSRYTSYCSTGGGSYELPIEGAERIRLRNYLEYDEDGMASFVDFRIVGLERRGGHDGI